MAQEQVAPVVLVILDGWGYREDSQSNAIASANTPVMDSLWASYPSTLIRTSGKDVGLPDGQMGNSEVGHLNIGSGRVVPQELVRISDAIEDGTLLSNEALVSVCQSVKQRNKTLHLVGLCSDGGVHSHLTHLFGVIDLAKKQGLTDVCIHAITDGRDTKPKSGLSMIDLIETYLDQVGVGRISTISGRYYSMDRDRRWDRTQKVYELMVTDGAGDGRTAAQIVKDSYENDVTDEFILPTRVAPGAVESGDGVIFFNFRPDRARQLVQVFIDPTFDGFERSLVQPLDFVTFTQYDASLDVKVAFEPQNLNNILGEVISSHGLKQLRTAETEKYAHVTYFFNGGIEEPFEGEDRELVASPMVATYDKAPKMSAEAVTKGAIAAVEKQVYSLIVINYANPDMVGHTGNIEASIQAIEEVDQCVGRLVESVSKTGGTTIIIADHGNAEYMRDEQGNPWTAHTTNPVPFILVEGEKRKIPGYGTEVPLRSDGRLADIAPTILDILKLPKPIEMTGRSMFLPLEFDVRKNRSPVTVPLG
ncbi:MAG: 2,3-bisphosphoglycerate-independent phosphoglycerate mutase [Leptolyngbyaceae bacterium]|nr:2,3-bisphosphoglycerate-independent phosphoglycerate mutase [Leptolyngbyaceae bacterium]